MSSPTRSTGISASAFTRVCVYVKFTHPGLGCVLICVSPRLLLAVTSSFMSVHKSHDRVHTCPQARVCVRVYHGHQKRGPHKTLSLLHTHDQRCSSECVSARSRSCSCASVCERRNAHCLCLRRCLSAAVWFR